MLPARQCFEAGDLLGSQIDQRLIIAAQASFRDGAWQVALDEIAFLGARVHLGIEEA